MEQDNPIMRFHEYCQQYKLGKHKESWRFIGPTNAREWHCYLTFDNINFSASGLDKKTARFKLYSDIMEHIKYGNEQQQQQNQLSGHQLAALKELIKNADGYLESFHKDMRRGPQDYDHSTFASAQLALWGAMKILGIYKEPVFIEPDFDMKNNFALNIKANPWVAKLEQEEEVDPAWSSTPSSLPYNKHLKDTLTSGKVERSRIQWDNANQRWKKTTHYTTQSMEMKSTFSQLAERSVWDEEQDKFVHQIWDESANQYKPVAGPDPKPAEILPYCAPMTNEQAEVLIEYLIQGYKAEWKNISVFGYLGNTFRQIKIGISSVTVPGFDQCLFSIQETTHSEAYGCETREQLLSNLANGAYRCLWTFYKDSDGQIRALTGPSVEEVD